MASKILGSGMFGLGGLLASKAIAPKADAAPATPTPVVMPTTDDSAVKAAKKRSIAAQMQRSGRSSTILTNNSDSLGGG